VNPDGVYLDRAQMIAKMKSIRPRVEIRCSKCREPLAAVFWLDDDDPNNPHFFRLADSTPGNERLLQCAKRHSHPELDRYKLWTFVERARNSGKAIVTTFEEIDVVDLQRETG
jgi:hypothetical protein